MFGGIKGMNIFYPDKIQKASKKLKLLLTAITINNTPAEKDSICVTKKNFNGISAIRLPFDKAVVSLNFVTPEYSTPDKITYAYYLQGWDKGWNYSGKNRTATYTRLHEGNYIFKVKAADAYGNWSAAQNLLNIVVLPPWYRTWWAYLFYIAVVISIIYLYIHYRSRQIKLQYQVAYAKKEIEKEKELNEKKLSFFTNISHEFRSPLTLIINPLKELMQSAEQTSEKTELNTVYRNAKRLLSLVDQLLLFRKADAAEDKLKVQKINFYNLSKEVYECFTQQAKAKHIHYSFNCDNVQLQLYGDYEKLEIILFNLLSNALKFTPDGGDVGLSVEEKMNAVEVRVSDSGCGVSEAEGNKLFNRFYQSNNKQSASTGFGIGLYLAKKFTSAHKGALMYESKTGKGTTFILTLQKGFAHIKEYLCEEVITEKPQLIEELSEDFLQQPQEHAALKNGNALFTKEVLSEKKKVIIADDDEEVRQYLKQILHDKYLVKECSDAESVLETATQQPPDLIISDVVMKEMNGITLCRKIKEESALTHIPVILLTSASSQEIKLNGIECGADDYIIKPFDKALLLARIENIFKTRSTLQQYFFDTITLQNTATKVSAEYKNFLERCIAIVEENLDRDDFSIKILSKEIGMSHSGLYKKIKLVSGLSANAFIRFIRLRRAAVLMLTANTNINEAAFQVGIKDVKYFRTQFNKLFGMNPSEYIKKYKHSFNKDFSFIID
jgi:signal transduction histidine kinase/DNA-binding response OmpR family regulator